MVIILRYNQKYNKKYYTQERIGVTKSSNFKWKGTPMEMAKSYSLNPLLLLTQDFLNLISGHES